MWFYLGFVIFYCNFDEFAEKGVGSLRAGFEFRMELRRHKKRMIGQLNNFGQFFLRIIAGNHQPAIFQDFAVIVVQFIAVAVAFGNHFLPLGSIGAGARR